jgi:hypothetical protein
VVEELRRFNTTDPRDKVYAEIGRASDVNQFQELRVDYSKTLRETHTEVAGYLFLNSTYGHQLDILGYCSKTGRTVDNTVDINLASLVPDWRNETELFPLFKEPEEASSRHTYYASGIGFHSIAPYVGHSTFIEVRGHILSVRGFPLDKIEDLKARASLEEDKFWDTSVEKSWQHKKQPRYLLHRGILESLLSSDNCRRLGIRCGGPC